MSQEIAVIVKDGQNVVSTNTVMEGSGATGRPLIVKAGSKQSIELKNIATGVAPDQIHVTKDGKNLKIKLGKKVSDADDSSDIIIEGYFDNDASLIGVAENGQYYNFIPQGANPDSSYYSLGGDVIGTATETDWLPIALALLGAGALAALAGGGDGGSHPDATPPAAPTITLVDDAGPITGEMPIKGANIGSNVSNGTTSGNNSGNVITDDNTPTINGNTEAGATVTAKDDAGNILGTDTADSNGNYSIIFEPGTPPLSDGQHYIVVTATDAAGNSSQSTSIIFTVDTVKPGIPTINPTDGSPITGTAEAGSTVTITYDDGTLIGTDIANANGNYSVTPTTTPADGTHLVATATDAAGNTGPEGYGYVDQAIIDAPIVMDDVGTIVGEVFDNETTDDTLPTFSGLAGSVPSSSEVTIYDGNTPLGTTTAAADGSWSFTPTTPFADGSEHTITYTKGDGTTHSPAVHFTVDTTAPSSVTMILTDEVAPITGTIANNGFTNDNTPKISGVTEAGATITIKDGTTVIGTTTANDSGNYTFTPIAPLNEGAHSVSATATDAAGNYVNSATTNFTVDTIDPTITMTLRDNVGSVQGPIANNGTTDDTTPTISGKTEANATITIKDGVTVLGTTTADGSGNYEFTPGTSLSMDTHTITATATDAAGNSITSAPTAFTIAPPAVIDLGDGNGQLIDPIFVDGNYYYYWDKDEDGKGMDDLNPDMGDWFTHNELDAIFKYDSSGNLRDSNLNDTNDTYRYADINGYHLALPTYGGDISNDHAQLGTAIDNVPAGEINPTYDDLVAIWDAYNGGSVTTTAVPGEPHGWATGEYWSATPYTYDSTMHYRMDISNGTGGANPDSDTNWTAVQVIF